MGTFIGPYVGAVLFFNGVEVNEGTALTSAVRGNALEGIDRAFFWLAGLILLLLVFMWASRARIERATREAALPAVRGFGATLREAFSSRWAVLGGGAIFLYVGAEVAIGTQVAFLLNSDDILDLAPADRSKACQFLLGRGDGGPADWVSGADARWTIDRADD